MRCEGLQECADAFPRCFDVSLGCVSEQSLELCEDLLDRIEIWTVGRQEEEPGSGGSDRLAHGLALVAAEIVDDDNVSGFECRHQELFDISPEAFAVDRPVDDAGRLDPIEAQGSQERQRTPVALRDLGQELTPARRPAAQTCHVGLGPSLVEEDQPRRVKLLLMRLPTQPPARDVGTVLLGGEQSFF